MAAHRLFAIWLVVFGFLAIHCKAEEVTESEPANEMPEEDLLFELEDDEFYSDMADEVEPEQMRVKRGDPTYNRLPLRTPPNMRGPVRPIYRRPRNRQPSHTDIVWAHMQQPYVHRNGPRRHF